MSNMESENLAGKEIRGYRIFEQIGAGAFGAVYRATQPIVSREVAIKMILPEFANKPEFIRGFEAEAQLVARLEHIHIVPLFDYWRDPNGAFLVMRLLPRTLKDEIKEGELGFTRVLRIIEQVSAALSMAHNRGVVHRDIKPGNILLDPDGNTYLADFGIAKTLETEETEGEVHGTPAYMSPEQITSDPVSPQSDIYSLGCISFEMLTGHKPFEGKQMGEIIMAHLNEPLPSLLSLRPGIPEAVDEVIQQATQKDPANRYTDAIAFAQDLARAFQEDGNVTKTLFIPDLDNWQIAQIQNPYKGLRAFQEIDSEDFYGRGQLIDSLLDTFSSGTDFLAVIGPSGSGKSSVVKAGLIPRLRDGAIEGSEQWFYTDLTPNIHPLNELEEALNRIAINIPARSIKETLLDTGNDGLINVVKEILPPNSDLVILIDQFEEAFTLVRDEVERERFLELVRTAAIDTESRIHIIVTLRADFMDHPLKYPGYGELIRDYSEFVIPLNPEELEQSIVYPAERVGLTVEPELVASIIHDIREEPGALPLLQYTLTEVFNRRQGVVLSQQAYVESGGVFGALGRRAEQIYSLLDETTQNATKQLFLRLVTLGEGRQDTRRRILFSELAAMTANVPNILDARDAYIEYRLLTTDRDMKTREPTLEVAHEALISHWTRLQKWLQDSRDDIRIQRRLGNSATQWRDSGRDDSYLLTGSQLEQSDEWANNASIVLSEEERAFLAKSLVFRRTLAAKEKSRQLYRFDQERKTRIRLQIGLLMMILVTGIATGLLLFSFYQWQQWEPLALTSTALLNESSVLFDQNKATLDVQSTQAVDLVNENMILQTQIVNLQFTEMQSAEKDAKALSNQLLISAQGALDADDQVLATILAIEAWKRQPSEALAVFLADVLGTDKESIAAIVDLSVLKALAVEKSLYRDLSCEEQKQYLLILECEAPQ